MKVYQYKHNEIFMIESFVQDEIMVDAYNKLFDELLINRNVSNKMIYESFNLLNYKITSAPHIVKSLLMKEELPAFKFLVCKN